MQQSSPRRGLLPPGFLPVFACFLGLFCLRENEGVRVTKNTSASSSFLGSRSHDGPGAKTKTSLLRSKEDDRRAPDPQCKGVHCGPFICSPPFRTLAPKETGLCCAVCWSEEHAKAGMPKAGQDKMIVFDTAWTEETLEKVAEKSERRRVKEVNDMVKDTPEPGLRRVVNAIARGKSKSFDRVAASDELKVELEKLKGSAGALQAGMRALLATFDVAPKDGRLNEMEYRVFLKVIHPQQDDQGPPEPKGPLATLAAGIMPVPLDNQRENFRAVDKDKNGFVTLAEFEAEVGKALNACFACAQPTFEADGVTLELTLPKENGDLDQVTCPSTHYGEVQLLCTAGELSQEGGKCTKIEYTWTVEGPWGECSRECDGGEQIRNVACRSNIPGDKSDFNGMGKCTGEKGAVRACNTQTCDACKGQKGKAEWKVLGKWSACSEDCGGGEQTRTVACVGVSEKGGESFCEESDCTGDRPTGSQECNMQECPVVPVKSVEATGWNDFGGNNGNIIYLDRHTVQCPSDAMMNGFILQNDHTKHDLQIVTQCEKWSFGTKDLSKHNTPCNDDGGGNVQYLDRHRVACPAGKFLQKWKMNRCNGGKGFQFDFECSAPGEGKLGKDEALSTQKNEGPGNGKAGIYLDRHFLNCKNPVDGLRGFWMRTSGRRIWFDYTCAPVEQ